MFEVQMYVTMAVCGADTHSVRELTYQVRRDDSCRRFGATARRFVAKAFCGQTELALSAASDS
jgi:hypothetical protein